MPEHHLPVVAVNAAPPPPLLPAASRLQTLERAVELTGYEQAGYGVDAGSFNPNLSLYEARHWHAVDTIYNHIALGIGEPGVLLCDEEGTEVDSEPAYRLRQILARPNPHMSGTAMFGKWGADLRVIGDCFGIRCGATGEPVEPGQPTELIYYVDPLNVQTVVPYRADGRYVLQGYRVRAQGTASALWSTSGYDRVSRSPISGLRSDEYWPWQMLHLRFLSDSTGLMGACSLAKALPILWQDREVFQYASFILWNKGTAGNYLTIEPESNLTQDQMVVQARLVDARTRGSNRGATVALPANVKVQRGGFTPRELMLDRQHEAPETRLCSQFGIQIQLVGWQAGLEHTNYEQMKTARHVQAERTYKPIWDSIAEQLTYQLVQADYDRTLQLQFDESGVEALAQHQVDVTLAKAQAMGQLIDNGYSEEQAAVIVGLPAPEHETTVAPPDGAAGEPAEESDDE